MGDAANAEANAWADFAVVVVDTQRDFAAKETATLARISALMTFAREQGLTVVHVRNKRFADGRNWPSCYKSRGRMPRCMAETPGAEACEGVGEVPGEAVCFKGAFDIWADPSGAQDFAAALRSKSHILVCGFVTSVCVLQCAIGAVNRGWIATLVEDCCFDDSPEFGEATLQRYSFGLGRAVSDDLSERLAAWQAEIVKFKEAGGGPMV
eukprot:TRINITY_DN42739_c0_g1_i1.p1 TRINITY_DN42739_c0_g1~~TRINITY_DN42739_c0_g1_i1.p1  ORF type:complete len:210 (-),score=39.18 TRINITY_DN42739_c0_g1_i1:270-899(-)